MLMEMIAGKHAEGEIIGRDAQSAFNTVQRGKVREVLKNHEWLREWIGDWLAPRRFDIEVDGHTLGQVTMAGGTLQGSPLYTPYAVLYW